jgi:hypothetical protein
MYKFYEYIYYQIYKWQLKVWKISDLAMHTATLGISTIQYFSIYILIMIYECIFKIHIIDFKAEFELKFISVIIFIILIVINSIMFKGNEKLIKFRNKYKNIVKANRIRLSILMWLNIGIIISFFLLLLFDALFFNFYFKHTCYAF